MNWLDRQRTMRPVRTIQETLEFLRQLSEDIAEENDHQKKSKVEEKSSSLVFDVLWGVPNTRKKRTWKGDGKLVVDGKFGRLYDEDGGYLSSGKIPSEDLLSPGSVFSLGSKEIEIGNECDPSTKPLTKKRIIEID